MHSIPISDNIQSNFAQQIFVDFNLIISIRFWKKTNLNAPHAINIFHNTWIHSFPPFYAIHRNCILITHIRK